MQCVFCQIVNGKISAERIYDGQKVVAFLDIAPAAKGHTLLVTKEHYSSISEIPNETLQEIVIVLKKIVRAVKSSSDGANVLINDGSAAGQLIEHFHAHIIPRAKGDGLSLEWEHKKYEPGEMKEWRDRLRKLLI